MMKRLGMHAVATAMTRANARAITSGARRRACLAIDVVLVADAHVLHHQIQPIEGDAEITQWVTVTIADKNHINRQERAVSTRNNLQLKINMATHASRVIAREMGVRAHRQKLLLPQNQQSHQFQ